jgi:hypothetical protein
MESLSVETKALDVELELGIAADPLDGLVGITELRAVLSSLER